MIIYVENLVDSTKKKPTRTNVFSKVENKTNRPKTIIFLYISIKESKIEISLNTIYNTI